MVRRRRNLGGTTGEDTGGGHLSSLLVQAGTHGGGHDEPSCPLLLSHPYSVIPALSQLSALSSQRRLPELGALRPAAAGATGAGARYGTI